MRVRPIRDSDLDALLMLARSTGVGVTTLPPNQDRLSKRIARSVDSFAGLLPNSSADYLFVLEDGRNGAVVGTCGIAAAVGMDEPWYNYRVGLSVHSSRELNIYHQMQTLFLSNDLTGCSELCSLFLDQDFRHGGNGSLLSKSRFLFLAEFSERFSSQVIAELRGVSDENGRSPFWESLGRPFFQMDFSRADYLTVGGDKSFIAELMPQHPLYTVFLSDEARATIGQAHQNSRPALAMLLSEGFQYQGYVDIFDAGPVVSSPLSHIRAVRQSQVYSTAPDGPQVDGGIYLLSNRRFEDFRVCLADTVPQGGVMPLSAEVLDQLEIREGDSVRGVPLSPKESA